MFVMAAADGNFYLMSRLGRVEKKVEAHKGAVLGAKWSFDGASLLTGEHMAFSYQLCVSLCIFLHMCTVGEDGAVLDHIFGAAFGAGQDHGG